MNKKLKVFIFLIIIVLVGYFVFSYLNKAPETSKNISPLSSTSNPIPLPGNSNSTQQKSADEFSAILSTVKSITIDTSLFDNQAYKMLRDFPVSLGTDVIGRNNPFAPIGVGSNVSITEAVSIQTIQSGKITSTTAELGAQIVLTDTVPTTVIFEYGISDTFGNVTVPVVLTKNGTSLVTITKLLPETTYYVRAVAVRGSSTTIANTTSFITTKK
jgi:hypothetical protein